MLGYSSTLDKSMNGVKTLTDGISIISDGIATHENIIYNDYIKSEDGQTELTNDTITTFNLNAQNITGDNITGDDLNTNILNCNYLYVNDLSNPLADVMEVNGQTKKLIMYSPSEFRDTVNVINKNVVQTQGGFISQTGTNFNTLKDTKINGFLEVGSNITQTGGNTSLKDVTCDNITQNTGKGITQSGTVSNTFSGTTTVKNLTILDSVTFPSNVTIPGTTTNDDIIMQDDAVITQDITTVTTKFNTLRDTKTLNLDVDGNINQTKSGATTSLKNTTIQGTTTLQGDIEQTSGFTKLNTIECNNITLRENNDINLSGTGKINQIGTGTNTLNSITLNNNQNITFNGTGIISQPLNGTNILSHFRGAGFGIIGGRNNTTFGHYQNIQNNNGFQMQYNRDNSSFYSYILNNRVGSGGGFRFQRYNSGVYIDEPLIIDDNVTFNKDVSIVGKSISASSATLGIITQNELDCLDNCNINILTKFNTLDNQISSLQTTTGGVSTATTGISYNASTDTTTIDNNLIVSSGKSFTLGSTNVNSFITDTNTFITASSNTLQGIVYTSGNDTTTINNNVSVTGAFLVQGMNVKAEIDALETSFTTGTLNTTTLTAGTLIVSNEMNMTNSFVSNRKINGIGYLNLADSNTASSATALHIAQFSANTEFRNYKASSQFSMTGLSSTGIFNDGNQLRLITNATTGSFNPTTQSDDILLFGRNNSTNMNKNLNLTVWSNTGTGVRIQPTKTTLTGGANNIYVDSTEGIVVNGNQRINNTINFYSGSNFTEVKETDSTFIINNKSTTNNKILLNISDENFVELNNRQMIVNTSFHIDNTAEFTPNFITQTSFTKTLGTSNIYSSLISVSEFKRQFNISIPISVYRKYKNVVANAGFSNIIKDTLNSVQYIIYKNGVFFSSGECTTTDILPKTVGIASTSSLSSRDYEIYFTNVKFSFIPTFEKTTAVYTIYITPSYNIDIPLQSDNIIIESFGYYSNTNISTSTYPISDGSYGSSFSSSAYTFSDYGDKYLDGIGSAKLNNVLTNYIDNQFEISTNTLITDSLASTTINNSGTMITNNLFCNGSINGRMNNGLAGYHIDGASNYISTPIFCSMRSFGRGDTDDYYFVNPGFKIDIYDGNNYSGFLQSFDNTNGTSGQVYNVSSPNRAASFIVYYLGAQVNFTQLS